MYQPPINIYETAMNTIIEQRENAIFAKIQDAIDVQVDRDELIRALQYDRGQYEKGFQDGVRSVHNQGLWLKVKDNLDIDRGWICSICNGSVYEMTYEPYQYCPHCGAKIEGWEDNDIEGSN